MNNFVITVDSSIDIEKEKLSQLDVRCIPFVLVNNNGSLEDNLSEEEKKSFFNGMRKGLTYSSSQINTFHYEDFFRKIYEEKKKPIIHISLCEGLSSSINNAMEAANNLKKENIDVEIVDATVASLGSYLTLLEAIKLNENGVNFLEAVNTLREKAHYINTYYTTDNLTHFANGGRLSKTSAMFGNALHLNVILDCDEKGKLKIKSKTLGKKKTYLKIANYVKEQVIDPEKQTLYCCHADNMKGMNELLEAIKKVVPFKDYEIHQMGATIGTHAGPDLLAVFFFGKKK